MHLPFPFSSAICIYFLANGTHAKLLGCLGTEIMAGIYGKRLRLIGLIWFIAARRFPRGRKNISTIYVYAKATQKPEAPPSPPLFVGSISGVFCAGVRDKLKTSSLLHDNGSILTFEPHRKLCTSFHSIICLGCRCLPQKTRISTRQSPPGPRLP